MSLTITCNGWSTEAPDSEGVWWLYGDPTFGACGGDFTGTFKPRFELHFVKVRAISNGLLAVCDGRFTSLLKFDKEKRREGYVGVWQRVVLPEVPTIEFK